MLGICIPKCYCSGADRSTSLHYSSKSFILMFVLGNENSKGRKTDGVMAYPAWSCLWTSSKVGTGRTRLTWILWHPLSSLSFLTSFCLLRLCGVHNLGLSDGFYSWNISFMFGCLSISYMYLCYCVSYTHIPDRCILLSQCTSLEMNIIWKIII